MTRTDRPRPPVVHTPGRRPNQWLYSGRPLALRLPCSGCGWMPGACQCHQHERDHEDQREHIELIEEES